MRWPRSNVARTIAKIIFGAVGASFMLVAFVETLERAEESPFPGWWRFAAGTVLGAMSLWLAGRAWADLLHTDPLPAPERRALMARFLVAQFGKYVPGGIWQAVGQVSYSAQRGISGPTAASAYLAFAVVQLAAAGSVGAAAALSGTLTGPIRFLSGAGLLLIAGLHRGLLMSVINGLTRWRRTPTNLLVPSQPALLRAWLWSLVNMAAAGASFAVVLSGSTADAPVAAVPFLWTTAWAIGFLAVPFPSGVGVREAILIAGLASATPAAGVIAASVFHRLATILAEALLVFCVGGRVLAQRRLHSAPPPG